MRRSLIVIFALVASPASAQHFEVSPLTMAAFTSGARISPLAAGVNRLEIGEGFTYGAQVGYLLSTHMSVEGWWTWQDTGMDISTASATTRLYYLDVRQLTANVVYTFGEFDQNVRPYVFGGGGATFITATGMPTDRHFAWDVGAGVKWFFMRHVGVRFDARYTPTQVSSSSSDYCVAHTFCQGSLDAFQAGTAMVLRF